MSSIIQVDEAILEALKASPAYKIKDRYGVYTAVQNPWKMPIELQKNGSTIASLPNADDWLVAPTGFFGVPKLDVYTAAAWEEISSLREETILPTPEPVTIDWNAPPVTPNTGVPSPYAPPVGYPQNPRYAGAPASVGQGLAITGIVLAVFAPIIGLVLSIIAFSQASKANATPIKTLAKVGIIVNAVLTAITLFFWIAVFGSAFSSIGDSDYSSSSSSDAVPAWWDDESANVLEAVNKVQPTFEETEINDSCEYSFIENTYTSSNTEVGEGELSAIAERYRLQLETLYPEADVAVTSKRDFADLKYFEVRADSTFDENYDYASPDVTVTVNESSTTLLLESYCD